MRLNNIISEDRYDELPDEDSFQSDEVEEYSYTIYLDILNYNLVFQVTYEDGVDDYDVKFLDVSIGSNRIQCNDIREFLSSLNAVDQFNFAKEVARQLNDCQQDYEREFHTGLLARCGPDRNEDEKILNIYTFLESLAIWWACNQ